MPLPTTYDPESVTYNIVAEGTAVPQSLSWRLVVSDFGGAARLEDFLPAIETGLQALATELGTVSDVTDVHVYRHYEGSLAAVDIA